MMLMSKHNQNDKLVCALLTLVGSIDEDWEKWTPTLWDHLSTKFMVEEVASPTPSETKESDPHVIFSTKSTEDKAPSKVTYYKQFNEKIFDIKNPYVSRVDLFEELHTPLSGR